MTIDAAGLELLFREARTHNKFTEEPISDETLHELYDILKFGPTSANSSPGRFLFLRTKEAKERLAPALSSGNLAKTMAAPVTVIVAYDPKFHDKLPKLFPHNQDAGSWFTSNDALAAITAFRNGTLQGAYLIIAARALGLDTGAMSGFRQRQGGPGIPDRVWLAVELPGQPRARRLVRRVSPLPPPGFRRSLRHAVARKSAANSASPRAGYPALARGTRARAVRRGQVAKGPTPGFSAHGDGACARIARRLCNKACLPAPGQ